MSSFVLKVLACIFMFIGHIPFVFPDTVIPCILIGKLAFPIFAFLISEGYVHTHDWKKYLIRLLILAVISQLPASLLFNPSSNGLYLNIFFTLAFGLISISFFDKIKNKYWAIVPVIVLSAISEFFGCDFGAIGVLMITCFYIFRKNKSTMTIIQVFLMMALFAQKLYNYTSLNSTIIRYILLQFLFTVMSLIFIIFYNGKRGKDTRKIKLGFYLFYPIHLTFLCILKYILI